MRSQRNWRSIHRWAAGVEVRAESMLVGCGPAAALLAAALLTASLIVTT